MALAETLLADIRKAQRRTADWFSIEDIRKRDRELEVSARYIQKTSGEELVVQRNSRQLYEKLEEWADSLLEREVRLYEQKILELCSEHSFVPSPEDDAVLRDELLDYVKTSVEELRKEISTFSGYVPDRYYEPWSKLSNKFKRLMGEMSNTVLLAGEISRLEMVDSGYEPVDRVGYAQVKIERLLLNCYSRIPHPFDDNKSLRIPTGTAKRAVRLITFVIFKKVDEPRLAGFEGKFINTFLRYLTCSRESSGAVVEQVCGLFEPFLKKLSLLFEILNAEGKPIWPTSLDGLIPGLKLSSSDLKRTEKTYWQTRDTEDAVLRVAYQLRHKAAHEAHEYTYYDNERHAYFVFAVLLVSCKTLLEANPDICKVVDHQGDVDAMRDLFVKIDELTLGPDGPRIDSSTGVAASRLQKLVGFSSRAQAVWPNCSATLFSLLESEYLAARGELIEQDREAEIDAYLESMRPDDEY